MSLSESFSQLFGGNRRKVEEISRRLEETSTELGKVRSDLSTTREELERTRRGIRSEYRTEILRGKSSASIIRGVDRLPYRTLRRIYRKSSTVRACVDTIVREVSNLPWVVRSGEGMQPDPVRLLQVRDFFKNPNFDEEAFRQVLAKALTDLMVLDSGVIERVWSLDHKRLLEIVARDGMEFVPLADKWGYLYGYEQRPDLMVDPPISFSRDEIIYLMLYPQTDSLFGYSIIESIVDEVATLLYGIQFVASAFTEDEIPPGILNLGEIGEEAYKRFKRDVRESRGRKKERQLRVVYGPKSVQWVDFKRANREMQTAELMGKIERIIYRNFGITPVEMGVTEKVPRASAEVQLQVSHDKMLLPVVNILNFFFNQDIVQGGFGFEDVEFAFLVEKKEDQESVARSAEISKRAGLMTPNEARKTFWGLGPQKGVNGDRFFITTQDGRIVYLDEALVAAPIGASPEGRESLPPPSPLPLIEEEEKDLDEALQEEEEEQERSISLVALDKMMDEYEQALREKWESVRDSAVDKSVQEIPSSASIRALSNLLFLRLKNVSRRYYPRAIDLGITEAERILEVRPPLLTRKERADLLEKAYSSNDGFLKENLVKDLRAQFTSVVQEPQEEEEGDVPLGVQKAFDSLEFRLMGYAGALNGVAHDGFAHGIFKQKGKLIHWRDRKDDRECVDCVGMGLGSPYKSLKEMKFLPGWGPRCSGRCRCYLWVGE